MFFKKGLSSVHEQPQETVAAVAKPNRGNEVQQDNLLTSHGTLLNSVGTADSSVHAGL